LTIDASKSSIVAKARPNQQAQIRELLSGLAVKPAEPRIEVYPITTFDPELAVKAIQTMLAGAPDVRLAIDAKANTIVAQARPAEHARIRELLSKLEATSKAITKPAVPPTPQSTRVVYEVKSIDELIKILQPLLAGQSHIETKSVAGNSQLIV